MNSPNPSTELLSEMIGLIYEASADLSLWPQLLESMAGYLELSLPKVEHGNVDNNPISLTEHSLMQFLAPHFQRAHSLHLHLAEVTEERNLLEKIMNRLPLGVAIIDAECNTISLNRAIISLLQGSALLRLVAGRLVSTPRSALESAIDKILSGNASEEVIRMSDDKDSLSLWITRGSSPTNSEVLPNRLMVFVASRTSHALSEQGLISFYGLTSAEARVTQKLALGCSLEESADLLGVAKSTVKTHLKRVFGKVGVKRQAELMHAIYGSPLWLQTVQKQPDEIPLLSSEYLLRLPSEEQKIQLADGRWLYFSDSGDINGHPVIQMHGIAGSRFLRHPDDSILMQEGIRYIIPERPGSGDSDPCPGRRVVDWPNDLIQLVDHLGLKSFSVLGYSAGTAYALAVAAAMPGRIKSVHLVAAAPPITDLEDLRAYSPVFRMVLFISQYTPGLLPALMRVMVKDIRKNVYQYLEKIFAGAPEQDLEILANPRLRANIAAGLRASVQRSENEIALEVMLTAADWEVDLNKISMPVNIWYGEKDPLVSPLAAKKLAKLLPDAKLTLVPSAGHYLLYSHWQDILHAMNS